MKTKSTRRFTLLAFFIALEIAFMLIPFLGFIPIPPIYPTTMHIPVIMAAIVLGPKEGVIVGFVFGILSIIKATITPTDLTAFMFSPFVTVGGMSGNFNSVLLAIIPRISIGLTAGYTYKLFEKNHWNLYLGVIVASIIGSLTNTIMVLGGIYLIFGVQYAQAFNLDYSILQYTLFGIVGTSGLGEAAAAAIICLPVYKASEYILHKR